MITIPFFLGVVAAVVTIIIVAVVVIMFKISKMNKMSTTDFYSTKDALRKLLDVTKESEKSIQGQIDDIYRHFDSVDRGTQDGFNNVYRDLETQARELKEDILAEASKYTDKRIDKAITKL